jgi:DNA-binding NtrC family response regulator
VILTPGSVLTASSFDTIRLAVTGRRPSREFAGVLTADTKPEGSIVLTTLNIDEAEATLVERALHATGGNRTKAAELLGVSGRTLRNKLSRQRGATGGEKS